jgi:hypothetical protein
VNTRWNKLNTKFNVWVETSFCQGCGTASPVCVATPAKTGNVHQTPSFPTPESETRSLPNAAAELPSHPDGFPGYDETRTPNISDLTASLTPGQSDRQSELGNISSAHDEYLPSQGLAPAAPALGKNCSPRAPFPKSEAASRSSATFDPTRVSSYVPSPSVYQSIARGAFGKLALPEFSQASSGLDTVSLPLEGNTSSDGKPLSPPASKATSDFDSQSRGKKRSAPVSEEPSSNKRRKSSSVENTLGHNRRSSAETPSRGRKQQTRCGLKNMAS